MTESAADIVSEWGTRVSRRGVVIAVVLAILGGCDDHKSASRHWKLIGQTTPPGMPLTFIEIEPAFAKSRAIYDAAVATACSGQTANVAFFLPGDKVPPNITTRDFFNAGGWSNYKPIVLGWCSGAGYTVWDCDRAGAEGAPASALCGEGVRSAYGAVLDLSGRIGAAAACGWPQKPEDRELLALYIGRINDAERRAMFQKAFEHADNSRGPDDRANCKKLRQKIEERAATARKVLGGASAGG